MKNRLFFFILAFLMPAVCGFSLMARAQDTGGVPMSDIEDIPAINDTATDTPGLDFASDTADPEEMVRIARQHYDNAVQLHMSGYLEEAIIEYKRATLLDPYVAAYHADMGEAFRLIGRNREAIDAIKRAIELDPALSNAYTTLGVIYDAQDLLVLAVEYHRKAIAIEPDHYIAYNNLGHAYDRIGLIKAAMANYQKAIDINNRFAPAYDNLGTNYLNIGQIDKGIEYIRKSIEYADRNDPQLPLFYNDMGAALVMKQDYQAAYQYFESAARMAPENPDIQRNYLFIKDYVNDH